MKTSRHIVFVLSALLFANLNLSAITRNANPKRAAQNQMELNQQACNAYKKADAEMNRLYRQILADNSKARLFVQKMRAAQRAWLAFRDAHLEALYPAANKREAYGSIHPMCECNELEKVTAERTKVLQQWIEGIPEGDVCAGSIKIKE
jgi:uncharacterized protein YecT (DUF1311 family)